MDTGASRKRKPVAKGGLRKARQRTPPTDPHRRAITDTPNDATERRRIADDWRYRTAARRHPALRTLAFTPVSWSTAAVWVMTGPANPWVT